MESVGNSGPDILATLDGEQQPGSVMEGGGKGLRRPLYGKWLSTPQYMPDLKNGPEKYSTSAYDYAKRFAVVDPSISESTAWKPDKQHEVSIPGLPMNMVPRDVGGIVLVPSREGNRWRPVEVKNYAELKQLNESRYGRDKRHMESWGRFMEAPGEPYTPSGFTASPGGDATRLWDTEFVPITSGPFFKQLYIYDYLKMHSTAFAMVNHNALAAAAIKIYERFTIGRGISYSIKDDQVRKVWESFWRRNNMKQKFKQMARDLPWQGELMLRFYEKSRGVTNFRVLDPSTCWEVVTDPEDIEEVYYYHFQWPTPYQTWVSGQIPSSKYIIQQVPPTNIMHIKVNVSSQEKRGRSVLLPAMPWIQRFNDFYNGQTIKAVLEANLVFKIKVKGDQTDVDSFLENPALTELPPPGGVWIENEAVDLTATSTVLTAGRGSQGIGQQIASIVAASMCLPNEYFNIEGAAGGARATALVRTDPAVKTIEDQQQILKETGEQIFERIIAEAINARLLDPSKSKYSNPDTTMDAGDDPNEDEPTDERPMRAQARLVRTVGR
jgi:hypothetical protein